MSFSWVPFYRELAGRVLEFEDESERGVAEKSATPLCFNPLSAMGIVLFDFVPQCL
jgi:hypothetical protein